jgi:hypothetical protein
VPGLGDQVLVGGHKVQLKSNGPLSPDLLRLCPRRKPPTATWKEKNPLWSREWDARGLGGHLSHRGDLCPQEARGKAILRAFDGWAPVTGHLEKGLALSMTSPVTCTGIPTSWTSRVHTELDLSSPVADPGWFCDPCLPQSRGVRPGFASFSVHPMAVLLSFFFLLYSFPPLPLPPPPGQLLPEQSRCLTPLIPATQDDRGSEPARESGSPNLSRKTHHEKGLAARLEALSSNPSAAHTKTTERPPGDQLSKTRKCGQGTAPAGQPPGDRGTGERGFLAPFPGPGL